MQIAFIIDKNNMTIWTDHTCSSSHGDCGTAAGAKGLCDNVQFIMSGTGLHSLHEGYSCPGMNQHTLDLFRCTSLQGVCQRASRPSYPCSTMSAAEIRTPTSHPVTVITLSEISFPCSSRLLIRSFPHFPRQNPTQSNPLHQIV